MAATDTLRSSPPSSLIGPANDGFVVTPSDTVDFTSMARALYVGGAGNVVAVMASGAVLTFVGVPAGALLPVRCTRVNNTNTTATSIVGLI